MKWLKSAWDWLDKKKMAVGTLSFIAARFFPDHTVTHQVLEIVGELFGGVGFLHKAVKKDFGQLNPIKKRS